MLHTLGWFTGRKAASKFLTERELARLLRAFTEEKALESVAFKAFTDFAILATETAHMSKTKAHITCLESSGEMET